MVKQLSSLGLREVVDRLDISFRKVKELLRDGELDGYFDDKEWRVYLYSVEDYEKRLQNGKK